MELNKSSNQLKISYFFNMLISALVIILNIFYEENISILMELPSNIVFYIFIIIYSLTVISQIIFLVLISERTSHKLFSMLLKISFIYLIISLSISITLFYFYYKTCNNYQNFYEDCPFNYDLSDINKILNSSNDWRIKEKCNNRICIEINTINKDLFEYSYLCNFDSDHKDLIYCNEFISSDRNKIESSLLHIYINLCISKNDFYICETNKKPQKYSIDYNYICPTEKSKSFILGIILSIFNIIAPILIFIVKYFLYKKILNLIYLRDINAPISITNRKTDNSSKFKENNKSNESFEQRPCELIIVESTESKKFSKMSNRNYKNKSSKVNLFTQIETTENPEIIISKSESILKLNKLGKINIMNIKKKKNNSFSNFEKNKLGMNNIDFLNNIKITTETKFYKNLNSARNNKLKNFHENIRYENSESRFIKSND